MKVETTTVVDMAVDRNDWWLRKIGYRDGREAKEQGVNLEHTPMWGDQFGNNVAEVRDGVTKLLLEVDGILARRKGEKS